MGRNHQPDTVPLLVVQFFHNLQSYLGTRPAGYSALKSRSDIGIVLKLISNFRGPGKRCSTLELQTVTSCNIFNFVAKLPNFGIAAVKRRKLRSALAEEWLESAPRSLGDFQGHRHYFFFCWVSQPIPWFLVGSAFGNTRFRYRPQMKRNSSL